MMRRPARFGSAEEPSGARALPVLERTAGSPRSDEELMCAYIAGDLRAFRQLFERYAPVLLRLMSQALYSRQDASDLVQQTFLQLHRARHDFDAGRRFRPWIFTIALNSKREYLRRRRRRPEYPLEGGVEPGIPPREQHRAEARRSLLWGLARLSDEHCEVIQLHWFEGLSFAEIGQCLGISANAAKVRAHRGYEQLRDIFIADDASSSSGNLDDGSGI